MNIYEARWNNARRLCERMLAVAAQHGASLMFDGELIEPSSVVIDKDSIYVKFTNSRHLVFVNDQERAEGLHETCAEFEAELKRRFVLVKKLEF